MPVPFNLTLTPAAPYVSLFGPYGANSWLEVFSHGTFGEWSQWTAIAAGPSLGSDISPGVSLAFNGSKIAVYGTMQWEGEGYNLTLIPDLPASGLIERWPGCDPISVCLSEPGALWQRSNLTNGAHNFTISTNYNLGVNTSLRGLSLTVTHIDITTEVPGDGSSDGSSSHVANHSIPTSEFTLSPEDQWIRASNGSLYTQAINSTLSINFTGTAIVVTTAQSMNGFEPYYASIDSAAPVIGGISQPNVGVARQGTQGDGEVMYMATELGDISHILNIRTTGVFSISRAYTFQAISNTADNLTASHPAAVPSLSSSANSARYSKSYIFLLAMLMPLLA